MLANCQIMGVPADPSSTTVLPPDAASEHRWPLSALGNGKRAAGQRVNDDNDEA